MQASLNESRLREYRRVSRRNWKREALDRQMWRGYKQKYKARYETVASHREEVEEELHRLYSSSHIIRAIKRRRNRWVENVACWGTNRIT